MKNYVLLIFIVIIAVAGLEVYFLFQRSPADVSEEQEENITKINTNIMNLTSPAFKHNEQIPSKYTCDGENINPPLFITNAPGEARSLALIVDDPDAPGGTWVHWTLWNIDPSTEEIEEDSVPGGAEEGETSFGDVGYGGPCPPRPSGTHRYFLKLYAVDIELQLTSESDKKEIEDAMTSHIIAQTELIGLYSREGK